MKIVIYSVIQKRPPIGENLIKWTIVDGEILQNCQVEAYIAIPDDEEERSLIPVHIVPDMIWSDGTSMAWEDFWSYSIVTKGE